ncbi:MAG: AAA family ATPase [Planctomycetota bacterium]
MLANGGRAPTAEAPTVQEDIEAVTRLRDAHERILKEIGRVIVGQREVIEQFLIALFSRGHCLIQGVPGLAKTLMVRTLSRLLALDSNRVQFTPDLMPSDITGTEILEEDQTTKKRIFRFVRGPIFTNVLLADEINRTPPKTQAALLEAMQEYRVTAGGDTHTLPQPFFVLATQNPLEQEGTYPLPEAQLDRFMFMVKIGYPSRADEVTIIRSTTMDLEIELPKILSEKEILDLQHTVRRVPVTPHVATYAADLARATRPEDPTAPQFVKDWLSWGAGPRAGQYLLLAAKARAALDGRWNVTALDVRANAMPVLRHRMCCNFNATSEGVTNDVVVARLLKTVREPSEKDY